MNFAASFICETNLCEWDSRVKVRKRSNAIVAEDASWIADTKKVLGRR